MDNLNISRISNNQLNHDNHLNIEEIIINLKQKIYDNATEITKITHKINELVNNDNQK
ncbi:MAG: hypothetical protein Q8897_02310 [Sweet potato little leaf phytoplasma]|nr:hypothetical protein [Sweet potato little leaf phytoplasma]MDV3201712.1 hypothetical protein [Candidatus Phytoplasma australasiaticum]MDO8008909.1 hypothetical protein [Sweet potato little leaf phytoplasma]MDO8020588.1 hypothetical protein [Sweet potato little leaf phytoplasma]MDV3144252.1 hypothetical protein [Sweet potato little leaf phytoplasma]MDV3158004.1 hypothetical protein [Sweet potato little leaf phytoplasma]